MMSSNSTGLLSDISADNRIEELFELWDELTEHGNKALDTALHHCMKTLSTMIDASNEFWVGTIRMVHRLDEFEDAVRSLRIRGFNTWTMPMNTILPLFDCSQNP